MTWLLAAAGTILAACGGLLLWALGLGLIQFAVFCAYLGLWNLARRASGPKEARR